MAETETKMTEEVDLVDNRPKPQRLIPLSAYSVIKRAMIQNSVHVGTHNKQNLVKQKTV